MKSIYLPAALLVLSGAAMGGPMSLQTEILRLQAEARVPGVAEIAPGSYPLSLAESVLGMPLDADLTSITTDLGPEALAGLLREPASPVEKPMLRAPEPSAVFMLMAGMVSFTFLGLGRRLLRREHHPLRKRIRTPYRMMA